MKVWLITGGAGFIGSHLVTALLARGEHVRVLDDLSTGRLGNIEEHLPQIEFIQGSITDRAVLAQAMQGVQYCLHQAAVPSVPRSVADPWTSNRVNVEGSLNVFLAARDAGVRRVVAASSSSVYGLGQPLPVHEELTPRPASPYAVSKFAGEGYGQVMLNLYGVEVVSLRYFNVFGPGQDPQSAYAAVIPAFIQAALRGEALPVHGTGRQARDFTHVDNVVQANLQAACCPKPLSGAFNIGCGERISLLDMIYALEGIIGRSLPMDFLPARPGDIEQSWADVSKAQHAFGYGVVTSFASGLEQTVSWYREHLQSPVR